ncbi:MAG: hypothetical protein CTY38_04830 [Methylotenera sp.]|uniref:TniQ family protein n=1 Tax=Methylotenera sp. TaxID=2051956 RepID=UPI000D44148E|nr:TniQ family protein [Methylotenera sp.]PPC83162.1 MAG: hypothetical protein CTY38_04830 [Methylotenera sp.]
MFEPVIKSTFVSKVEKSLALPSLLPDEFIVGYLGRVAQLNGFGRFALHRALKTEFFDESKEKTNAPSILLIARGLKLEVAYVMKHHSLTHILKATRDEGDNHFKSAADKQRYEWSLMNYLSMRYPKNVACFCKSCVMEDLEQYKGVSLWRRSHQLPGIDWCLKHNEPLQEVLGKEPFILHPGIYLSKRNYCKQPNSAGMNHPIILRYAQLVEDALELDVPVDRKVAKVTLVNKAKSVDIKNYETGRTRKLSDLMREQLPEAWILKFLPKLLNKSYGAYFSSIDEVLKPSQKPKPYISTLLAAAVLFEDADEAMQHLTKSLDQLNILKKKPKISDKEIEKAYVRHRGNYAQMGEQLDRDRRTIFMRGQSLGLPSLTRVSLGTLQALRDFYEGADLFDVLLKPNVDKKALANIIRVTGQSFFTSIKKFGLIDSE